ncbi:MAG: hypothetical protein BJ554DRAFT_3918 [Olpidium bornovanus]|uniref:Uncharacterized protein n=1 Tax=Olpidium bornovanus TaxID=278681 RepID=A0A8H7ZNR5_9FUNG|nr:MAG: hypothetical protein BJ554DRAFT_3918 [Olpidium bornovanus]
MLVRSNSLLVVLGVGAASFARAAASGDVAPLAAVPASIHSGLTEAGPPPAPQGTPHCGWQLGNKLCELQTRCCSSYGFCENNFTAVFINGTGTEEGRNGVSCCGEGCQSGPCYDFSARPTPTSPTPTFTDDGGQRREPRDGSMMPSEPPPPAPGPAPEPPIYTVTPTRADPPPPAPAAAPESFFVAGAPAAAVVY